MLIKRNKPSLLVFTCSKGKEHRIIPGINDLPDHVVADMLDDDIIAGKFESEEMETLSPSDLGANTAQLGKKKKGGISGVDVLLATPDGEAKKLAKQTVDTAILDIWLRKEKRPSVRIEIQRQIAKIRDIKYRKDEEAAGKKPKKYEGKKNDSDEDEDEEE